MNGKILYLGDTALDQAASYLAGLMTHYKIGYDYVPNDVKFDESLFQNNYKAIVVSDYPTSNFLKSHLDLIAEKVKNGAGFLMIGGWESFEGLAGKYSNTVLADVLPVEMSSGDDRINCSSPFMVVRNCGHQITDSLPFESNATLIGGLNSLKTKKNGTEILSARKFRAEFQNGKFNFMEMQSFPLLVVGQFGKGNTAAFASDIAPHWIGPMVDWGCDRITAKAPGGIEIEVGNWYAQLFVNIIKWVTKEI
ncbi:MAG: hypothetical protein A2Y12_12355 [Planctomycetes bacterium GWF2_42_9]|nr:MAG: hypothetical protein A2Y12_12355 [Planctomycetes bacterium GWF2_42_9]